MATLMINACAFSGKGVINSFFYVYARRFRNG